MFGFEKYQEKEKLLKKYLKINYFLFSFIL